MDKWCIKINRVKTFLKGLGQNIKGYNRKYKLILEEELETLERLEEGSSLPANLLDKIIKKTFIQSELLKLLEEEGSYWHTEFFHRIVNGGKTKKKYYPLPSSGKCDIEGMIKKNIIKTCFFF